MTQEREARRAVADWVHRAVAAAEGSSDELVGCSSGEIEDLAMTQGRAAFPAALDEYLRICGQIDGPIGAILDPAMTGRRILRDINVRARRARDLAGIDDAPWREGVVFADSTNGTVFWMPDEGSDPRVRYLVEGGGIGELPSFTAFLELSLAIWQGDDMAAGDQARWLEEHGFADDPDV